MDEVTNFASVKHRQFRGLARVRLSDLKFDGHRTTRPQNVRRLSKIFQIEGCHRLDERNYIDVVVTDGQICAAHTECLQDAPPQVWESSPVLDIGPLECLTGRHRVRAAQQYLDANDQWWVARIYSSNLSRSPCLRLTEEYLNEQPPSDGEIFYKIRQYRLADDEANELKWWARLTETKRKDLKQLLRDARYADAFDNLLPWPGLWAPVRLGSLHRLLCLKCDEELLAYVYHISATWRSITVGVDACDIVDAGSVEQLQGLAPHHSTVDAQGISDMMSSKKIFGKVNDERDRTTILANLLSVKTMIPSLFTFFEDLKYLEPCSKVLKGLLPPGTRRSVTRALMGSYFQPDKTIVEHASRDLRIHYSSAPEMACALACQQLWLFAFRNFPLMTNFTARKEADKDKPAAVEPSPCAWREFADLASSLGFKTPRIDELRSQDSTKLIVAQLFERFTDSSSVRDANAAEKIAAILRSVQRGKEPGRRPSFVNGDQLPVVKRCGRPFEDDHCVDKPCLYLPHMYGEPSPGANVTTFYRKWNMFRVFMGIEDSPRETFVDDVAIDDHNSGPNAADETPVNDGRLEHDHVLQALQRQIEQQAQELREARSEHERVVGLLEEKIAKSARDKDGIHRTLHEMKNRLQEEIEDKRNLSRALEGFKKDEAIVRELKAELCQSAKERNELRLKLTELTSAFEQVDKSRVDGLAKIQILETELKHKFDGYDDAHIALQNQHSAQMLDMENEIRALKEEQMTAIAAHTSTVDRMKGELATKNEHIQSLQLELAEKATALLTCNARHDKLQSENSDLSKQLSDLQEEHRLLGQANDKMTRDGQRMDEAIQRSTAQAGQDRGKINELELKLGEAEHQIAGLRFQASVAQEKLSILEVELTEARECAERHAQIADQEQDTRYDAEVAVMNQKVQNAISKEVASRIQDELDQANDRRKEMEGKMQILETRMQSRSLPSTELTLVTWEKVGDVSFIKAYFTCRKEDALQCVRSLDLCSQENCSKWDYIGFDRRRIPSSMKQDEKHLVDVWMQGGIMGRWLAAHRSFFESRAAQRADMPSWADRPKLTLKRKSPAALPEGAESRAVKRALPSMGVIEEITWHDKKIAKLK